MLLDIVIYLFYLFFCFFAIIGYGFLFEKIIFNSTIHNIAEVGFFGFFLIFFISTIFHFFIPLFPWFNFSILFIGLINFFINFNLIKIKLKDNKKYFLLTIILLPILITTNTYTDYEWYHLPYVNYLNNFKIIFGLVNLSNSYAYGHGWLEILGIFTLPYVETKGLIILGFIFFYFFISYLLIEIINHKSKSIKIFSVFLIVYSLANFNKLSDFGAYIQPTLIIFILILYILKLTIEKENMEIFSKIIFYFFFTMILRIGSIIIFPLILLIILLKIKYLIQFFIKYIRLNIFLILFLFVILLKNFIISGCLSYPIYKTCFNNEIVTWASPSDNARERFELLSAISKRWKFYTMEEANLDSRFDYFEPMKKGLILSPKDYNNNKFFWLKYWHKDHDVNRLLNSFLIVLFCFSIFFILSKNRLKSLISLKLIPLRYNIIHIGFISSILMWFFLSPQMIYGGYAIIGGTLIYYSSLIINKLDISKNRFKFIVAFILILSSSYYLSKNINRIMEIDYDELTHLPWPKYSKKVLDIDYKQIFINDTKLNLIIKSENMIQGEPIMCGNVDMLCMPDERVVCISNIEKKNNYIFITNKDNECLLQFKKNYWQH